jgi:hypothetical protein
MYDKLGEATKPSPITVVAAFNNVTEQAICGMFSQKPCDDPAKYYVTLVELKNETTSALNNVTVYIEVRPFSGYVQVSKLSANQGSEIESFVRGDVDENGFARGNTGTYKLRKVLPSETNVARVYTIWPLMDIHLHIRIDGVLANWWIAECGDKTQCENGEIVVAVLQL